MLPGVVDHPILKGTGSAASAAVAWFNPTAAAATLAAILNLLLIIDWFWKRFGKPYALSRGWLKGKVIYMEPSTRGDLHE